MEFSRQEYWSGLPFPSPGNLLDQPGIEPLAPALAGKFFIIWATRGVYIISEIAKNSIYWVLILPWWLRPYRICLQCRRHWTQPRFNSWVRKIPWRRKWQLPPVFLPGEFCEQRSQVGYSPWGRKESDTTEWLNFTLSFHWVLTLCKALFWTLYTY